MITAQDIREKTFAKGFQGYDMGEVDDFLEELAADLVASQKENAAMRGKMKVLVDKIEEYRGNEQAMQLALISAQKVAQEIQDEAQAKADELVSRAQEQADAIIAEAQSKADAVTGDLKRQRADEENRLAAARDASASFIAKMLQVCATQNEFLTELREREMGPVTAGEETVEQPIFDPFAAVPKQPEKAESERTFEENVYAAAGAEPEEPEEFEEPEEYEEPVFEQRPARPAPAARPARPAARPARPAARPTEDDEDAEPTRMFRF